MKYKVMRAFLLAGIRQEVGDPVELTDRSLIGTLTTAGKIEPMGEELPPGPMTTASTTALTPASRSKATKE